MNNYLSKSVIAVTDASQIDVNKLGKTYVMANDSGTYLAGDILVANGSSVEKISKSQQPLDEKILELSSLGNIVFGLEPDKESIANVWGGIAIEYDDMDEWIPYSQYAQTSGVTNNGKTYAFPYMNNLYATRYVNAGGKLLPENYATTGNRKLHLVGIRKLCHEITRIGTTIVEYQETISSDYQQKVNTAFPPKHNGFVGSPQLRYANIENVQIIDSYTFQACSKLQYLRCDSLSSIAGPSTFEKCVKLEVIDWSRKEDDAIPVINNENNTFLSCGISSEYGKTIILVPDRLYDAWAANSSWATIFSKYQNLELSAI